MNYRPEDHTFAICAYGESPFLEACILSLKAQTVRTGLLIATSTPSEFIRGLADHYDIPVFENPVRRGIGADWNFAYNHAGTPLITVAHQDDLYEPTYAEQMLQDLRRARAPILWFCDYSELRNGQKVYENRNLKIKHLMLRPLKSGRLQSSRFVRRRILSLGCPIPCPSVTYVAERAGRQDIFSTEMKVSLDWDQWERQSRKQGAFVYRPSPLFCHRIHEGSATTALIANNLRSEEDLIMFRRFWPPFIAGFLARLYGASLKSNQLE